MRSDWFELAAWLAKQRFAVDDPLTMAERAYRRTWNAAIDHVIREIEAGRCAQA